MLPLPAPIDLEEIQWEILEAEGGTFFALKPKGFEALSRNVAEVTRWTTEAKYQLDFYRRTRGDKEDAGE